MRYLWNFQCPWCGAKWTELGEKAEAGPRVSVVKCVACRKRDHNDPMSLDQRPQVP